MVKHKGPIAAALEVLGKGGSLASQKRELEVIPTDIGPINDIIFACGGLPLGKVIELYSIQSVGKSTFAYWLAGQVQKRDGIVALADAEGAYVPSYGAGCGIDNEKLIMINFHHGEDGLDKIKMLIATGAADLIIADSMPAFQPLLNIDQIAGDKVTMNKNLERAKMYTRFFNDLMGGYRIKPPGKNQKFIKNQNGAEFTRIYETNTTVLFINHVKTKIGVVYGERTYTPGGDAINFASSIRISLTQKSKSQSKHKVKGITVKSLNFKLIRISTPKNKLGIPFGETFIKMFPDGRIKPADPGDWDEEELEEFGGEMETDTEETDTEVVEETDTEGVGDTNEFPE